MSSAAQFWVPAYNAQYDRNGDGGNTVVHNPRKHLPIASQRISLPIYSFKDQILYAVERYRAVVLVGETGSGKSTQIPQYLNEAGWTAGGRCIVCTQPRRIAATSVSARVAEEVGTSLGTHVGYSIRFDSKVSEHTVIKYCTDGVLLRETMSDPLLSAYSVIMVDEAHERSLQSDILIGLLKKIMRKRPELRVIITSATLNAHEIKDFFEAKKLTSHPMSVDDTACILPISGRTFPVSIFYLEKPCRNYLEEVVGTVIKIHAHEEIGDILVFLPGSEDIDSAVHAIDEMIAAEEAQDSSRGGIGSKRDRDKRSKLRYLYALPLYSSLPAAAQLKVFEKSPPGYRKVVFSTNIAETSITLDGISYVVDAGFVKTSYFDVHCGVSALITCAESQATAKQRAGRAGRTAPGKCYRLMTEAAFHSLPDFTPPEMQRGDITGAVLQLKALGIEDVVHFDFLSPPPAESMIYALEVLYSLGALDIDCKLTPLGAAMAEMPLDPRLSKTLLASFDFGCGEEILSIAAMCSVDYPYIIPRGRVSHELRKKHNECISELASLDGDHLTLLNIYNGFVQHSADARSWCDSLRLQHRILIRANEIRRNLRRLLLSFAPEGGVISSSAEDSVAIRKCIVSGFFGNVAKLGPHGRYVTARGARAVTVHSTSVLSKFGAPPEWVVFHDVVHTSSAQIRDVTKIEPLWLLELAGKYYTCGLPMEK